MYLSVSLIISSFPIIYSCAVFHNTLPTDFTFSPWCSSRKDQPALHCFFFFLFLAALLLLSWWCCSCLYWTQLCNKMQTDFLFSNFFLLNFWKLIVERWLRNHYTVNGSLVSLFIGCMFYGFGIDFFQEVLIVFC